MSRRPAPAPRQPIEWFAILRPNGVLHVHKYLGHRAVDSARANPHNKVMTGIKAVCESRARDLARAYFVVGVDPCT